MGERRRCPGPPPPRHSRPGRPRLPADGVPIGDSPFSGGIYRGDLTHRTLLGSSVARQLAMEAGFKVCQVRSPVLPVWGLGLVRAGRRMAVRLMQTLAFSFVRHVLMGEGSAVVSPNMIVVLRKEGGQT